MTTEIQETGLTVRQNDVFALPEIDSLKRGLEEVRKFQATVKELLIEGHDYGVIPGTTKPTLLKPGAEKIDKILKLADSYEEIGKIEDWGKPLFYYKVKCQLTIMGTDVLISEGMGSCNSMEGKYRWRESKRKCPVCKSEAIIKGKAEWGGGWLCYKKQGGCGAKFVDGDKSIEGQTIGKVENDDIYTLVNTILKMAKKRAHIDASLSAGRLSDVFTQDIEDIVDVTIGEIKEPVDKRGEFQKEGRDILEEAIKKTATKPEASPQEPQSAVTASKEEAKAEGQPEIKIDLAWLKESLDTLNWTGVIKWLNDKYKKNGRKVSEIVKQLTPDEQIEFAKEVQSRLSMN